MEFKRENLQNRTFWDKAGIALPPYDVAAAAELGQRAPRWVHFGIGNIFRIFIGGIADELLRKGVLDRGVTCVESFDYDIVDQIYRPHDNLSLSVILHDDGTQERRVIGAFAEAISARNSDAAQWERLKEVFRAPSLQLVSFTITEKGYALRGTDGTFLPGIVRDIAGGPDKAVSAMAIVTAMLYERFRAGGTPIALVSMDNCSRNGSLLQASVNEIARQWQEKGYVTEDFLNWLGDPSKVSFPWTMIDKITPRPEEKIAKELEAAGIEGMDPVITSRRTYIAPFANAEGPQYLVIEDDFPNGRPALDEGSGVYLADRKTVNLCERMKVTACLNPVHSALGPLEVVLGIPLFADGLKDPALLRMANAVAYQEGMPMLEDPGILSPKAFTDELFEHRFSNEYLGDTNLRLSTDVSQGLGVRFGVTIGAYVKRYGSAERLRAIPLGIAGWLRYMMGVDDAGKPYELAPDPLNGELTQLLSDVHLGEPESLLDQLHPFLSNQSIFFVDLYAAGLGNTIEGMLREMIRGKGAARATLERYYG